MCLSGWLGEPLKLRLLGRDVRARLAHPHVGQDPRHSSADSIQAERTQLFMTRAKMAWCSQRGVAHTIATAALLLKPGTTLIRPACSA